MNQDEQKARARALSMDNTVKAEYNPEKFPYLNEEDCNFLPSHSPIPVEKNVK